MMNIEYESDDTQAIINNMKTSIHDAGKIALPNAQYAYAKVEEVMWAME